MYRRLACPSHKSGKKPEPLVLSEHPTTHKSVVSDDPLWCGVGVRGRSHARAACPMWQVLRAGTLATSAASAGRRQRGNKKVTTWAARRLRFPAQPDRQALKLSPWKTGRPKERLSRLLRFSAARCAR